LKGEPVMLAGSLIRLNTEAVLYCSCINVRVQDGSITLTGDVDQIYQRTENNKSKEVQNAKESNKN
jgi:osmotically-inducible protein OsmY